MTAVSRFLEEVELIRVNIQFECDKALLEDFMEWWSASICKLIFHNADDTDEAASLSLFNNLKFQL